MFGQALGASRSVGSALIGCRALVPGSSSAELVWRWQTLRWNTPWYRRSYHRCYFAWSARRRLQRHGYQNMVHKGGKKSDEGYRRMVLSELLMERPGLGYLGPDRRGYPGSPRDHRLNQPLSSYPQQ